ncbi:hypothetical protein IGB42_01785 [Andreprevotia sp. IGB-42]|nr:hypothetical protein IGB42_01785 [Andreprevotia sp. IGB-42]
MSWNKGGRGGGRGGGGQRPQQEKSHSLTRMQEGPYVFPVQAPHNAYTGRPQPQVPSLFGGNVDRGETHVDTVRRETHEESQGHFQMMPGSHTQHPSVDAGRYQQHLFTSVVQPHTPVNSGDQHGQETREMSGHFMPSLTELNTPTPLTTSNVQQHLTQSFMAHAGQQNLQVTRQDVDERMGWHTMQFAQQQLVNDSQVFHAAQTNYQQARDGLMPPPFTSRHTSPYQQSIADEAYNAMPPLPVQQHVLPPVQQQVPPRPSAQGFMDMEMQSEAEFNARRQEGTGGFGNF